MARLDDIKETEGPQEDEARPDHPFIIRSPRMPDAHLLSVLLTHIDCM